MNFSLSSHSSLSSSFEIIEEKGPWERGWKFFESHLTENIKVDGGRNLLTGVRIPRVAVVSYMDV